MAKLLGAQLLLQWREAPKAMPPRLTQAAKILLGKEITSNKVLLTIVLAVVLLLVVRVYFGTRKKLPPAIPGLPMLGNLLQLTEKEPHLIFTAWAQKYGPIFTIRIGSITAVVVNNSDLAKEALVTKFASITKLMLLMPMKVVSRDKTMVAISDYGEEHRMLKKLVVTNLLNPTAQNKNRPLREEALVSMVDGVLTELKGYPNSTGVVNVREYAQRALFRFGMIQVWGYVPDQVEVPELGATFSTWDMLDALVADPDRVSMNVDWRDFFPALKWIPNRSVEDEVRGVDSKRNAIMNVLIQEQRKRLANLEMMMSLWEPIIESSDATLLTLEWAMYELAKNPECQERLYQEIVSVVGTERMVTEDDLPNMPYLKAVIKETLRQNPPVPLLPARLIEEDITLGGYDIPKGNQIIVNQYAIAKDPAVWSNPEKFDPERLLGDDSVDMGIKNFSLMPFGAGKRQCPGIIQEIDNMNKKVEDVVYLSTQKLEPLTCVATPRIAHRLP